MTTFETAMLIAFFAVMYYVIYKTLSAVAAASEAGLNDGDRPAKRHIKHALKAKPGSERWMIVQNRIMFI